MLYLGFIDLNRTVRSYYRPERLLTFYVAGCLATSSNRFSHDNDLHHQSCYQLSYHLDDVQKLAKKDFFSEFIYCPEKALTPEI